MDRDTTLNKNRIVIIIAILAAIFFGIFIIIKYKNIKEQNISEEYVKAIPDYSDTLKSIEAKSFYVYDISEAKAIFAKDEHLKLPLASITKLMSGLIISNILPGTTIITISKDDILQEGDSGLIVGEKWKLKDLLDFSLLTSSNDGIHALESALNSYEEMNNIKMVELMNNSAIELKLEDTTFINATGLDIDSFVGGAYSSSHDVSILFEKILKDNPALISDTKNQLGTFISLDNIRHNVSNTNISINNIPGILASKTGFTDLAGGNLAVIFDAGFSHPIVVVVLGSSEKGRFTDVEKLVNITLKKLSDSD